MLQPTMAGTTHDLIFARVCARASTVTPSTMDVTICSLEDVSHGIHTEYFNSVIQYR